MKRVMCAALLALAAVTLQAQATPTTAAAAPQIPDDARRAFSELQVRASGLTLSMAILQKELDATQADFTRLVQRLQAQCATVPGYELSPSLTCVPKKDEPKKEPPK